MPVTQACRFKLSDASRPDTVCSLASLSTPRSSPACVGLSFTPRPGSSLAAEPDFRNLTPTSLAFKGSIRAELEELRLSEHFDTRGVPSFPRLGVSLPAKRTPQAAFGSYVSNELVAEHDPFASDGEAEFSNATRARSTRLAFEAIEKDAKNVTERNPLTSDAEVKEAQLARIFEEIPEYSTQLPLELRSGKRCIKDATVEEERNARRNSELLNRQLRDPDFHDETRMKWLLQKQEAVLLAEVALTWQKASRGCFTLGIERPTFCRLCWDLELVDKDKAPYYWIVSLFDERSAIVRAADDPTLGSPPFVRFLNFWSLVEVVDIILRQFYTKGNVFFFVQKLQRASRARLGALADEMELPADDSQGYRSRHSSINKRLSATPGSKRVSTQWARVDDEEAKAPDMQHEMLSRERLLSSMLIQPEVLHLAMQQKILYLSFHRAYADDEGRLSPDDFMRFCADFCIVPDLVTTAWALRILGSVMTAQSEYLKDAKELVFDAETLVGVDAFMEVVCKICLYYLGSYGNVTQQSSSAYVRLVWMSAYLRQVAERGPRTGPLPGKSEAELQAILSEAWRLPAAPKRPKMVNAFNGTLAGSTDGVTKVKSIPVPSLRNSIGNARGSIGNPRGSATNNLPGIKDSEKEENENDDEKEIDMAPYEDEDSSDPDLHENYTPNKWNAPSGKKHDSRRFTKRHTILPGGPSISRRSTMFTVRSMAIASQAEKAAPKRRSVTNRRAATDQANEKFLNDIAKDCKCPLCWTDLRSSPWGMAFCNACAIVDTLGLSGHPFRRLLRSQLKDSQREVAKPTGPVPPSQDVRIWHSRCVTGPSFSTVASTMRIPGGSPQHWKPSARVSETIVELGRTVDLFRQVSSPLPGRRPNVLIRP